MAARNPLPPGVRWLLELGLSEDDLHDLTPCVPGEFTYPYGYYINSSTPRIVYHGTEEGTLPLVAGRWYLISTDAVERNPGVRADTVPVARAVRLIR